MAFVAAPLTRTDAALLRRLEVPRARQWVAAAMIAGGGFVALILTLTNTTLPVCTIASPCAPDPGSKAIYTGMAAVIALAVVERRLAAYTMVVTAAGLLYYNHLHPGQAPATFATAAVVAAAVWCVAWAELNRPRRAPAGWKPEKQSAPAPQIPVRSRPIGALIGLALIALGFAAVVYGQARQASVEAQMRDATVAQVKVVGHPNTFVIRVAWPPDSTSDITVKSTRPYRFESTTSIAVDDKGLLQPLAEPYDGSFFWTYAVALWLGGLGLALVNLRRVVPLRRLTRRPQPATWVYVRRRSGHVLLFSGEATAADLPFAELPVRDDLMREFTPSLLVSSTAAPLPRGTNPQMLPPERATLYGTPIPGRYCTVTVGSLTLSPKGPLRTTQDMLPFGSLVEEAGSTRPADASEPPDTPEPPQAPAEVTPAEHVDERPLTPEEQRRIRPEDAATGPDQVLYHQLSRVLAYGLVLAAAIVVALGLSGPAGGVGAAWLRTVLVAVVLGLANYAGWRLWLRPVVAWSGGGVTVRSSWRRPTALAWSSVSRIGRVGGRVWLDTARGGIMSAAPWQTRWFSGRSPDQLTLALRQARLKSRSSLAAPPASTPGDRRDVALMWLVQAGATIAVVAWLARPA
jgi:hypothetical protein